MAAPNSFAAILATSERVGFRIDDVLREDAEFDFTKPFLPEGLMRGASASRLAASDARLLNQVRAHTYLSMFGLVEEFILPFVLDHARADLAGDTMRTRALLNFANEEAKHIQLFQRFRASFERGFGSPCELIGPAEQVVRAVLSHGPLSVGLAILHIEWMTQLHYVECVKEAQGLEPNFERLLKVHWLEESQHARLDTVIVEDLAAQLSGRQVEEAIEEYLSILADLAGLLDQQLELELSSLGRARGRELSSADREAIRDSERAGLYWTFLGSGMTHPRFLHTLDTIAPGSAARVRTVGSRYLGARAAHRCAAPETTG